MEDCAGLLALAHSLDIQVVGVAFHVGSGATNPQAFADAIAAARQVGPAACMCCCSTFLRTGCPRLWLYCLMSCCLLSFLSSVGRIGILGQLAIAHKVELQTESGSFRQTMDAVLDVFACVHDVQRQHCSWPEYVGNSAVVVHCQL